VIHLKGGTDLDDSQFVSPKRMRDAGGQTQYQNGNRLQLMVFRPEMAIGCEYEKEKLGSVMVNVGGDLSGKASLTVDGESVSLPISEKKLFEAMGEPRRFEQHKHRNWVD
jgi:hypothetical protein